jgi:hypothetical protein
VEWAAPGGFPHLRAGQILAETRNPARFPVFHRAYDDDKDQGLKKEIPSFSRGSGNTDPTADRAVALCRTV